MLRKIGILLALASSIWVLLDARKGHAGGLGGISPVGWSMLVLFLWIVGFPLYLLLRRKDRKVSSQVPLDVLTPSTHEQALPGFLKFALFVAFIAVAALLVMIGSMSPALSTRTF